MKPDTLPKPDIASHLDRLGGIASSAELKRAGYSDRELTAASRSVRVRRLRRGWYSTLSPSDPRAIAVTLGGRLTGAAALRRAGAWMWRDPPVDVSVPRNAARLRPDRRVRHVFYDQAAVTARGDASTVDLIDAFPAALRLLTFEESVAVIDWALASGVLDRFGVVELATRLPAHHASVIEWADSGADSFFESVVRTRLRLAGHSVTTQASVGDLGAIDLVVDGLVAVEVDGFAFHAHSFESDRRKDLQINLEGRPCLRITAAQIENEWPVVLAAIESALERCRRRQSSPPRTRTVRVLPGSSRTVWRLTRTRSDRRSAAGMQRQADMLRSL